MILLDELRAFGDRLIVRPDPKVEEQGAIILPDVAKADNPNWFTVSGVVLKVGDGMRDDEWRCSNRQCGRIERRRVNHRCSVCGATAQLYRSAERRPFDVQVGDRVTFNRFAGKQIEVGQPDRFGQGEKVLIMREIEVLGVVEGAAELLPGYERPSWDQVTSNKGDDRPRR
jgi:co-chaperonin GroES (HSP10)